MTATNINIDEFIHILEKLRSNGNKLINMDMLPDENHPNMNKLIIHPVDSSDGRKPRENKITIKNPDISTDNNDIFNSLNNLL